MKPSVLIAPPSLILVSVSNNDRVGTASTTSHAFLLQAPFPIVPRPSLSSPSARDDSPAACFFAPLPTARATPPWSGGGLMPPSDHCACLRPAAKRRSATRSANRGVPWPPSSTGHGATKKKKKSRARRECRKMNRSHVAERQVFIFSACDHQTHGVVRPVWEHIHDDAAVDAGIADPRHVHHAFPARLLFIGLCCAPKPDEFKASATVARRLSMPYIPRETVRARALIKLWTNFRHGHIHGADAGSP